MSDVRLPPGWPPQVRPPGTSGHVRSAVSWLLDQCPSDYRAYPVLQAHPVALAWIAVRHVTAQGQANTAARTGARAELRTDLEPVALDRVLQALDAEHARLLGVHRAVQLVSDALRGLPYIPRL